MAQLALAQQTIRNRLSSIGAVRLVIAAPLILFLVLELTHITQAWLAVQNAARFGIRYTVTQEFDSQYCAEAAFHYGLGIVDPGI